MAWTHVWFCSLLSLLAFVRCNSERLVLISLSQRPADVEEIRIDTSLDARVGESLVIKRSTSGFGLFLPDDARGTLLLEAQGFNQYGVLISTGSMSVQIGERTEFPLRQTLSLDQSPCSEETMAIPPSIPVCSVLMPNPPEAPTLSLDSIWGSSPNDIWGVGATAGWDGMIAHWNGRVWSTFPTNKILLRRIWGSGPNDIWAVGGAFEKDIYNVGIIYHWNGINWTQSASVYGYRRGVWGSGPNDVWAVGDLDAIYHFDGSAWSKAFSPPMSSVGGADSVWGTGPLDAWATAEDINRTSAFIIHWNGSTWSKVPGTPIALYSITGSGPNDIWADGSYGKVNHWNGMTWSTMDIVDPSEDSVIRWASSPSDAWASGRDGKLFHWDGSSWTKFHSGLTSLNNVWGTEPNDVWVLGGEKTIRLKPCVPTNLDIEPPVFSGITSVTRSNACITLKWDISGDNSTPASHMTYNIYKSTGLGKEDYSIPIATTPPGSTTYTITDSKLNPNDTYYFVVRAQDQAGHTDANTVEKSLTGEPPK